MASTPVRCVYLPIKSLSRSYPTVPSFLPSDSCLTEARGITDGLIPRRKTQEQVSRAWRPLERPANTFLHCWLLLSQNNLWVSNFSSNFDPCDSCKCLRQEGFRMGISIHSDQPTIHALTVKFDEDGLICQIDCAFDASISYLLPPIVAIQFFLGSMWSILLRDLLALYLERLAKQSNQFPHVFFPFKQPNDANH